MVDLAVIPRAPVLAASDPVRVAARAVVRFHLHALTRLEGGARAGEVAATHQLRVATRRLRAALRLFGPVLSPRFAEAAGRDLGWVGQAIGAVRDLDVLAATVKARAERLDPQLRSALGPVGVAIHEQRLIALGDLVRTLDSARCRQLLARLARFADTPARPERDRAIADCAPALVHPLVRAAVRAGRRLDADSTPAQLHRLRVRIKRLRYALETLAFAGKSVRRARVELERLQDLFGAHQDAIAGTTWLWRYTRAADGDPRAMLPVGALVQALTKRAAKTRRRALKAWRKVVRSGLLDELDTASPALRETA